LCNPFPLYEIHLNNQVVNKELIDAGARPSLAAVKKDRWIKMFNQEEQE
jgi:hypothetical protein